MPDYSSFLNERTAEFYLAPQMSRLLKRISEVAIPIHFWQSREGSKLGRQALAGHSVRIVAVFARRPKMRAIGERSAKVKINSRLFDAAVNYHDAGIPTFAGVPLATDLIDLRKNNIAKWFYLKPEISNRDLFLSMNCMGQLFEASHSPQIIQGPLIDEEVIEIVEKFSLSTSWEEAINRLQGARRHSVNATSWMTRIWDYKPFYLLLID